MHLSTWSPEFAEFLRVTVATQPRLARLGGRPGTRSLVKAYLSLRLPASNDGSLTDSCFANSLLPNSEQNGAKFEVNVIDVL